MAKETAGAHKYGPILSPMEEDFKPSGGHEAAESVITNGLPGLPKGSSRTADEVTLYQGGNFGKVKKNDQGRD